MARKHIIENLILVMFTTTLCLSIYFQVDIQLEYYPSFAISANELSQKPAEYFALPNPDKYVLAAINRQFLTLRSLDETQIDNLMNSHGTPNIEYNGTYYWIGIVNVDSFPPFALQLATFWGIPISASAIGIICLIKTNRFLKSQSLQR
jgi:hypothetical protein